MKHWGVVTGLLNFILIIVGVILVLPVSAGVISEESFIKDNLKWLDNLKLRASFGITGGAVSELSNYDYLSVLLWVLLIPIPDLFKVHGFPN